MPSIKQNLATSPLPDFRNFGVMLRIVLGVNLLALTAALVKSEGIIDWPLRFLEVTAWAEPLLLLNLLLAVSFDSLLRRLRPPLGHLALVLTSAGSAALLLDFWRFMAFDGGGWSHMARVALLGGLVTALVLLYFALRASAFPSAVAEARLQALTARIRPHFLFNSLNAVLSLIRSDPRRAETALEELADLFRTLMRDHRELLPLADEIALCRQYLDLEKLRLGERLCVEWEIEDMPTDLKVPPLMLQPLLENAVYYGIEPSSEAGTIQIRFSRRRDSLHIDLSNPYLGGIDRISGHGMALENIRERLALHYDIEASLKAGEFSGADGRREYRVHIELPCRGRRS